MSNCNGLPTGLALRERNCYKRCLKVDQFKEQRRNLTNVWKNSCQELSKVPKQERGGGHCLLIWIGLWGRTAWLVKVNSELN